MSDDKQAYNERALPEILRKGLDDPADEYRREELLNHLAERISVLMERQSELLFSLLYRLDVSETKIEDVFAGRTGESISEGLARLIIERQEERIQTRQRYSSGHQPFQWTMDE